MTKPILLTVDDDPEVLRAVERDLRSEYGARYRVMRAESGAAALDLLARLELRGDPVALLLVDQRMPEMQGVDFLERAIPIVPAAKRVLLTAYADTDAAIRAINTVRIHYYLMKPWDPPEQNLYPFLNDLLDDWQASYRPPFDGIRVIGPRWSPKTHRVRDFLGRNLVPCRWLDVETSEEARNLVATVGGGETAALPLVILADGRALPDPDLGQLARHIGLRTQAEKPFYDLAVVGAGPAGLAAAVYGASEGLRTLIVEREAPGGQAGTSSNIENYLGFPVGLTGADLARRAVAQARKFGTEILTPQEVLAMRVEGPYRVVTMGDGSEVSCRVLLVSTGVSYRKLGVPGSDMLTGAGIYYGAAISEAMACRDEDVHIVGAGNSAGQAAMHFAKYAERVTIVVRSDDIAKGMSQYLVDQIAATPNIRVIVNAEIVEALGAEHLNSLRIIHRDTGETETVPARALFVLIGIYALSHSATPGDFG